MITHTIIKIVVLSCSHIIMSHIVSFCDFTVVINCCTIRTTTITQPTNYRLKHRIGETENKEERGLEVCTHTATVFCASDMK